MTRIVLTAFAAFATTIVIAAAGLPAIASRAAVVPTAQADRGLTLQPPGSPERPFNRYYLAEFNTKVGSGLPSPALCLLFTASGNWSAIHNDGLNGTYLLSGRELFATALGDWSPRVYMSLHGVITAKQGSGTYIVSQKNGDVFSGGTFVLIREYSSGCS